MDEKRKIQQEPIADKHEIKHAADNKKHRIVMMLLLAIVAYAIIYSVVFAQGPSYNGDDVPYSYLAHFASIGIPIETSMNILSTRILHIYPIAFFYAAFGVNMYSSVAWDIISFVLTIIIIFYIGKELQNEYVGLLAALLFAFSPMIVTLAGTVGDNPPMVLFVSLAMLALLYGIRMNSRKWYFVCGLALVAAFLTIPLALLATVMVVLYLIVEMLRRKIKPNIQLMYLACGFAVAVLLLMVFNYSSVGQPLISFTSPYSFFQVNYNQSYGQAYNPQTSTFNYYLYSMFPYQLIHSFSYGFSKSNFDPILIVWQAYNTANLNSAGFFFYAFIAAIAYLLIKREKRAYFAIFMFVVGFLLLEFDPAHVALSPFVYLLQHRLDRYLLLIVPFGVILIAQALVGAVEKKGKNRLVWYAKLMIVALVVIFLIATAIPINIEYYTVTAYERQTQIEIANYLNALPNTTVVYSAEGQLVPIYMRFDNISRFRVYNGITNCESIPPGSYLTIPIYSNPYNLSYVPDPHLDCPNWQLVLLPKLYNTSDRIAVYNGRPFQLALWYVPENGSQ
jgi:4-amino-4-deoxy-L-arabinose transferase-like glycosyltransferase